MVCFFLEAPPPLDDLVRVMFWKIFNRLRVVELAEAMSGLESSDVAEFVKAYSNNELASEN